MLAIAILWSGLILRPLILLRGFQAGIIAKYAWFYSYIASGLLADAALYVGLRFYAGSYSNIYWTVQFVTLAFGCGVILEIFEHVLSPYAGAEKVARFLLVLTFMTIFCLGLIYRLASNAIATRTFYVEIERNVRSAQIIFFVAILVAIFHYLISLGRNMRGMMWGYGLYLCASLFTLAFRTYLGHRFDAAWRVLQPFFSSVTLCVWLYSLWSYYPNPAPAQRIDLDSDYENLVAMTKQRLNALRHHIGRTTR